MVKGACVKHAHGHMEFPRRQLVAVVALRLKYYVTGVRSASIMIFVKHVVFIFRPKFSFSVSIASGIQMNDVISV